MGCNEPSRKVTRRHLLQATDALCVLPFGARKDAIVSVDRGDFGKLYDRNGSKVLDCVEANLSTGRCVVFHRSRDGAFVFNNSGDDVERLIVYRLAPLRFEHRGERHAT